MDKFLIMDTIDQQPITSQQIIIVKDQIYKCVHMYVHFFSLFEKPEKGRKKEENLNQKDSKYKNKSYHITQISSPIISPLLLSLHKYHY